MKFRVTRSDCFPLFVFVMTALWWFAAIALVSRVPIANHVLRSVVRMV